jgi:hypothetical protein
MCAGEKWPCGPGPVMLFCPVCPHFLQVALKGFTPPDTEHGYLFTFWGRAAASQPGVHAAPKVVFQDADDSYTPLKQVSVPLTTEWQMYEVDISLPLYRKGHKLIICFWLGEYVGSYALDDFQVDIVRQFDPPPPPPPTHRLNAPPPPGVVALLGFEGTDDGVTSQRAANNGSWSVTVPDARAAHTGGYGIYVEVTKAWRVASLARLLLPRCVLHSSAPGPVRILVIEVRVFRPIPSTCTPLIST